METARQHEHVNSCLRFEILQWVSLCVYRCGHQLLVSNNGIIPKGNSCDFCRVKSNISLEIQDERLFAFTFKTKKIHILLDIFTLLIFPKISQKGDHETWLLPSLYSGIFWFYFGLHFIARRLDIIDPLLCCFDRSHDHMLSSDVLKILTSHKMKTW